MRENGVRNEESTRKHGCGVHVICSQCFAGKEGENWGRRKGDVASKEARGLVAKLQQAASCVPAEPDLLILHKGMLVDGLHNISEEDLRSERVTVVYHRLSVRAVPTVNCQTKNITSTTQSFWCSPIFLDISDKY